MDAGGIEQVDELVEIQRVTPADKRLEHLVHPPPFVELAGKFEQAIKNDGGAELMRRGLIRDAVAICVFAGDAQVHASKPHHGFEIESKRVILLIMPAGLEL